MMNPMDLTGQTILVTGASSGIGRETARLISQLVRTLFWLGAMRSVLRRHCESWMAAATVLRPSTCPRPMKSPAGLRALARRPDRCTAWFTARDT